jgi:hypothetical protein
MRTLLAVLASAISSSIMLVSVQVRWKERERGEKQDGDKEKDIEK